MFKIFRRPYRNSSGFEISRYLYLNFGFRPKKSSHYQKVFIHKSLNIYDEKGDRINFERLEFLGDSILGTIVTEYLFKKNSTLDEGKLTKMRAEIVCRDNLNKIAQKKGLIKFLKTSTPTKNFKDDIHGNLLEALLGAIYLDRGLITCKKVVIKNIITA